MISTVITIILILAGMYIFDFSALKMAGNTKAWAVYLALTGGGCVLIGVYLTMFNPPSPLKTLGVWLQPLTGWLSI